MDDVSLVGALPDVHELFQIYDQLYFSSRLQAQAVLEWSDRMTSCAGVCYLKDAMITIRLSRKLLQFRPFSDTINTLLHEMVHAFLFITAPRSAYIDRDGHGPAFLSLAARINSHAGSAITVYHSFADEVLFHKQHVWRCTGRCAFWPPYYGWVRRAVNRAPQPADRWFRAHQANCGGAFVKVKGPAKALGASAKADVCKTSRLGGTPVVCPSCSGSFENPYKLESHIDVCLEKNDGKESVPIYLIE